MIKRSHFFAYVAALVPVAALAQSPPIRLLVPFPAGGITDLSARALAEPLATLLGQTVIVDNRPGGGSRVGTEAVNRSAADGTTLLFTNSSVNVLPIIDPSLTFMAESSMVPVGMLANYGLAFVVSKANPATTLAQWVTLTKQHPGRFSYGSSGPGSGAHFMGEYFKSVTGAAIVHIPYRSTSAALNDVVGGTLDMTFDATAKAYADTGKVRILAVSGSQRDPRMPQVPTAVEAGLKDFVMSSWMGILAPSGTPPAVVKRLNTALNTALADPVLRQRLLGMGLVPEGGTPERMRVLIQTESALYKRIATNAKLHFD